VAEGAARRLGLPAETVTRVRRDGRFTREHIAAAPGEEAAVMRRFVELWEQADVDGIVAMLADEALLTMPPEPMAILGAEAIGEFFRSVPAGGDLGRIRLVPSRANGQPALAAYFAREEGAVFEGYGVMVFALDGEAITGITGFAGMGGLLTAFGLPSELEA